MSGNTFVYNNARHLLGTAGLNWPAQTATAALVNGAYSPSPSDVYLSAVPHGAVMVTAIMTGLTVRANGACYGVIPQFNALTSGSSVVGLLIYNDTGDPTTSALIYYSDDGVGFPFQPIGFNYAVGYDQANGGFFQA